MDWIGGESFQNDWMKKSVTMKKKTQKIFLFFILSLIHFVFTLEINSAVYSSGRNGVKIIYFKISRMVNSELVVIRIKILLGWFLIVISQ
jgi:hypothetical protein